LNKVLLREYFTQLLMKLIRFFISLTLVLFSMSASAEYYRYFDKDGNVHYTDDLTDVPKDQRTDIHEYTESQSNTYDVQTDEQNAEKSEPLFEKEQAKDKHDENDFAEIRKRLDVEKQALNEEYRALMEERKQITEDQEKFRSKRDVNKHNKIVSELNKKIEDFDRRKEAFDAEVEKYNTLVEESNLKELEKRKISE